MKTALDWLLLNVCISGVPANTGMSIDEILEKAKEMQKQQLGEFWDAALDAYERRAGVWVRASEDFDEYFEDRFK